VKKVFLLVVFLAGLASAQGLEIAWWKMPAPVAPALAPNVPGFSFGDLEEGGVMVALVGSVAGFEGATYKFTLQFERDGAEGTATVYSDYRTYIFWVGRVVVRSIKVEVLTKVLVIQKDG
jgi:hypothetical protein